MIDGTAGEQLVIARQASEQERLQAGEQLAGTALPNRDLAEGALR